MPPGAVVTPPPGVSHVFPPSLERSITCPNQPLVCDAYSRFGSAGDPFKWEISQPSKCGALTSHRSRLASDVMPNAPLRVPTSKRTPLIPHSFPSSTPSFCPSSLALLLSSDGRDRNRHSRRGSGC